MWKLASKLDQTASPHPLPSALTADELLLRRASEWMLACWRRARGGALLPPASALDDLFATEFGPYCVGGRMSATEGARITRLGRRFSEAFEQKAIGRANAFSAATMLGIAVGLAGELQNEARPVQRAGDFTTEGNRFVCYHAVVLPFRGGPGAAPAWLVAADWNIAPLSTLARRRAS